MGTAIPQKPTTIPAASPTTPNTPSQPSPSTTTGSSPSPSSNGENLASHTPTHLPVVAPPTEPPHTPPPLDTPFVPSTEHKAMHNTIAVHTAVATPSHAHEEKKEVHENTSAVPAWKKILFIILGVIFFTIYAVFWLLFFKVKLPF